MRNDRFVSFMKGTPPLRMASFPRSRTAPGESWLYFDDALAVVRLASSAIMAAGISGRR